jgi:hypothetical protein
MEDQSAAPVRRMHGTYDSGDLDAGRYVLRPRDLAPPGGIRWA